jgi:hypothetical protein
MLGSRLRLRLRRKHRAAALVLAVPIIAAGTAYMAANVVPVSYVGETTQTVSFTTSLTAHDTAATGDETDGYSVPVSTTLTFNGSSPSGPISGGTITFKVDSTHICTDETDASGNASCTITGLSSVPSAYTASFATDGSLQSSSDSPSVADPL